MSDLVVPRQNFGCTKVIGKIIFCTISPYAQHWVGILCDEPFRCERLGPIKNRYFPNRFHLFIGPRFYASDAYVHHPSEQNLLSYFFFKTKKTKKDATVAPSIGEAKMVIMTEASFFMKTWRGSDSDWNIDRPNVQTTKYFIKKVMIS